MPAHRQGEKYKNNLKILETNIRGLRTNIGELSNLCNEQKPSIVIVVESFLNPSVKDGSDRIAIPGYSLCCRRDRTENHVDQRGGIAIYCAEGVAIHHDAKQDPKHLELMWFSVALNKQKKLLIGAIYRPPSANSDIIEYLDSVTLSTSCR